MPKHIAFIMDPLETVIANHDTTHELIREARRQGHHTYFVAKGNIELIENRAILTATEVMPNDDKKPPYDLIESSQKDISKFDCVWIRLDPPFDDDYLTLCHILAAFESDTKLINHPNGIRSVNEKLWAYTHFPDLCPKTTVTRHIDTYKRVLNKEKNIIIKPINGYGGSGVFKIRSGDSNANVMFETLSQNGQKEVIIQPFIKDAARGDKRILLLDGEILAAVLRVHSADDHRNNAAAGGNCVATSITQRDKEVVQRLAPELKKLGLRFVGIDMLGDYLVEVNVTSPTCLQEANAIDKRNYSQDIISAIT